MVSSIQVALHNAGAPNPRNIDLRIALAKFRNNGGTEAEALAEVRTAFETRRGDQRAFAEQGQAQFVPSAQPKTDEKDQCGIAEHGPNHHVFPSVPVPTERQRRIIKLVAEESARTVLDTCKTSDGRAWGDVGFHELDAMDRDGDIARRIRGTIGIVSNKDYFKKVRDLLTPGNFDRIWKQAKESRHGK